LSSIFRSNFCPFRSNLCVFFRGFWKLFHLKSQRFKMLYIQRNVRNEQSNFFYKIKKKKKDLIGFLSIMEFLS
jgi:hypothetical protein